MKLSNSKCILNHLEELSQGFKKQADSIRVSFLFAKILNLLDDGIVIIEKDNSIIYFNESFKKHIGEQFCVTPLDVVVDDLSGTAYHNGLKETWKLMPIDDENLRIIRIDAANIRKN